MNITTVRLYLHYNEIVTINYKAFWISESNNKMKNYKLKILYLHYNNIEYIKSGTFDPLVNLEDLSLANNKLI